jgi:MarR family transcriptional regulator, organic hydroperoxide resistance regulator
MKKLRCLLNDKNLNDSLGSLISKANWHMRANLNLTIKENALKVTSEQWVLLNIINNHPGIAQTEIARTSLKDKTNVTRMLDILQKNGYISRNDDQTDRRMYRIYLTIKGKKILTQILPLAQGVNRECIKNLGKSERENLHKSLVTIIDTLSTLVP